MRLSLSSFKVLSLCGLFSLYLLCAGLETAFAQETGDSASLVLAGATLIDGTGSAARSDVTIVITDGRISEIVDGDVDTPAAAAQVIDLSGRYLVPGLIDAHVHVANGPDPEGRLRSMADRGVTTVRDMGGDARTLAVLARDAKLGKIRSPNIYYSAVLYGPPFLRDPRSRRSAPDLEPGTAPWSRTVTADSDWALVVAEAKGTGATGLKLYSAVDPRLLPQIVGEAHRQGLKVWSHATIFPSKPSDAVAAGVDVISHASGLYPEARSDVPSSFTDSIKEWMPKQDFAAVDPSGEPFTALFALMRRQGTLLEPTVAVFRNDRTRARAGAQEHLTEAASRIDLAGLSRWICAVTREAHEAGVTLVAGTDSTPRRDQHIATELETLVECGLSPLEALRAATLHGARAIGIEDTHGSVEVGKVADLVILAADPTEDIANVRQVVATVQSGRLNDLSGSIE